MIQNLSAAAGEPVTVSFTPTLAPMPRGILATCSAKAKPGVTRRGRPGRVREGLRRRAVRPPAARGAVARHRVGLRLQRRARPGRLRRVRRPVIAISAIDNLTKGTAGGAVQSMNIALGLPEEPRAFPRSESHRDARDRSADDGVHSGRRQPQPPGRHGSRITAGPRNQRPDLALVVNNGPRRAAAGVFTSNRVKAAPVLWSEQVLKGGEVTAVVLNSGGANACTGPKGFQDTHATAEKAAEVLAGHSAGEVAVASTGLIGVLLPMDKLLPGIEKAAAELSEHGGEKAAIAIKTTDTVHKTAVVTKDGWTVGGMAKGAGMLAPGLATMLVVLTTDADLDAPTLDTALRDATRTTFDRVDSDGCMSTNDTVLLLASGASEVTPEYEEFAEAVRTVCADLARQLIGDAEGASKDIRIEVINAATEDDAVEVGRSIARNNLLKCAIHGEDPNWGRVLSAIGTTQRRLRAGPAERRHQRRLGLPERIGRRGPRPGRHALPRGHDHRRPGRRHASPPSSGPTTSPPTTSTRTARTAHERPPVSHHHLQPPYPQTHRAAQGPDPHRGAALADPTQRQDRRHQVRRQRHGRRGAEGRLRPGRRLPAAAGSSRSSCTAAARRSAPSSTSTAWSASSRPACGSPRPRRWTSSGWCSPGRSSASWSGCSTSTARSPSA